MTTVSNKLVECWKSFNICKSLQHCCSQNYLYIFYCHPSKHSLNFQSSCTLPYSTVHASSVRDFHFTKFLCFLCPALLLSHPIASRHSAPTYHCQYDDAGHAHVLIRHHIVIVLRWPHAPHATLHNTTQRNATQRYATLRNATQRLPRLPLSLPPSRPPLPRAFLASMDSHLLFIAYPRSIYICNHRHPAMPPTNHRYVPTRVRSIISLASPSPYVLTV